MKHVDPLMLSRELTAEEEAEAFAHIALLNVLFGFVLGIIVGACAVGLAVTL